MRRAWGLVLLALLAGCAMPDRVTTLSESNNSTLAEVTPTQPFEGVAGTPTPAPTPTEATPTPSPSASPTTTPSVTATPTPVADVTQNATPTATPTPTANATASAASPSPTHGGNAAGPTRGTPKVAVGKRPLGRDGAPGEGRWGGWDAAPGARGVGGESYLVVQNTGDVIDPIVTIRFEKPAFQGETDPSWLIPIVGNVEFAAFEDVYPGLGREQPQTGRYEFVPATGTSVTLQFHGSGHVLYVAYRIVSMPVPLLDQTYSAPFSVSVS